MFSEWKTGHPLTLCALEHVSVIHLAPCSIHHTPPGCLCPHSYLTPHSIHCTPPGHLCPRSHLTPCSIHRAPMGCLCPHSHLTPHSIHRTHAHTTSPLAPSTVPPRAIYPHARTSPLTPSTVPAIYAHAQTTGCAIHALHTHVCNPCPPSDHITCAIHLTPRSIHRTHLHSHPSPCVVICHQSLAILVHGQIHLLVAFRSRPHARMHARSCMHLPMHKDPDTPHAHVPLPSLMHMQSSTRRVDTARQGGGGACYPPARDHR